MTELASVAVQLAGRGIPVFPLAMGSKVPMPKSNGFHDASTDCDVARARWIAHPHANIGIATGARSGIWVLDIDPKHGGNQSLASLMDQHGRPPATVSVHTPSGGLHLWFRCPAGLNIRNSAGRVGQGIDVRGEGGYVVCPPSVLSNGGRYRWVESGAGIVAEAPQWLVRLAAPPPKQRVERAGTSSGFRPATFDRYIAGAIRDELDRLARARDGTRNHQLNKTAFSIGQFVKAGAIPEDWAVQKLETIANDIGLPQVETQRTIASAFQAAPARELG